MALRIRLRRMGRKNTPHFRIVVSENTMPRDGRFVDRIGYYNPRTEPVTLLVDRDKARGWLAKGATATDTVRSLLRKAGADGGTGVFSQEPEPKQAVPPPPAAAAAVAAEAEPEEAEAAEPEEAEPEEAEPEEAEPVEAEPEEAEPEEAPEEEESAAERDAGEGEKKPASE